LNVLRRTSVLFVLALLLFYTPTVAQDLLRVHFFDVGQGDAVLIQSPSGQNLVYDGGPSTGGMLAELNRLGVSKVELVIASHNHADHISGLPAVLARFRPRFYMDNGIPATTFTYIRVLEAVHSAGSQLLEPTAGRISLGEVVVHVLPPPGNGDQKDNSIGVIIEYGAFRLSLAGDASPREWEWWLKSQSSLVRPVQVHKASHHGSADGDISTAISRLAPKAVVISVGGNNSYGHPTAEALALYRNATVYRTDLHGTIVVEADRSGRYTVHTAQGQAPRPPPVTTAIPTSRAAPASPSTCIDINTASAGELEAIIHIGEVRAQEIVALRRVQPFRSVRELTRVNGIAAGSVRDIIAEGKACVR
jgi:competence protein ComEC